MPILPPDDGTHAAIHDEVCVLIDERHIVERRLWEKGHERLLESNPEAWERQRNRFISDLDDRPYLIRGENLEKARALGLPDTYNRLALMAVSVFHLSHWRLDVTITNYLLA